MNERVLYFDCSAGASGDMVLAALIDVGVPFKALAKELEKLGVPGFRLARSRSKRGGIAGTRIRVITKGDRGHRHWSDFERLVGRSRLSPSVKERSLALIWRIFEAEAAVHGETPERVHLHELGSLDTLVDVVGAVSGLELLDVDRITSSPINVGGGSVETEHGLLAIPAPATTRLLQGAPTFSDGDDFERTTPTGALLVTAFAEDFGAWPSMTVRKMGFGLGSRDPGTGRPNALRLVLGNRISRVVQSSLVIETTIDDSTPEQLGYLQERLWEAGVHDVFLTSVQMKKNRPGVNVTVLAPFGARERVSTILFTESSTIGLRCHEVERDVLDREWAEVETAYGTLRIKEALRNGKVINVAPEFEDAKKLAVKKRVSLKQVQQAALVAYRRK
jgi:uncharacterized protein (TIGR00299 family) protein